MRMRRKRDTNYKSGVVPYKDYIGVFLAETKEIIERIDRLAVQRAIEILAEIRKGGGRLFILGVGGSAANASHAVNDFRKICKIEAYTPVDNVAELTAWTNDSSFDVIFKNWLEESKINSKDGVLVFSVGGGSETTSRNIGLALEYAKSIGAKTMGIASRDGGMTKKLADVTILVPVVSDKRITPHAEAWQGVLWHLMVNALNEHDPTPTYGS